MLEVVLEVCWRMFKTLRSSKSRTRLFLNTSFAISTSSRVSALKSSQIGEYHKCFSPKKTHLNAHKLTVSSIQSTMASRKKERVLISLFARLASLTFSTLAFLAFLEAQEIRVNSKGYEDFRIFRRSDLRPWRFLLSLPHKPLHAIAPQRVALPLLTT